MKKTPPSKSSKVESPEMLPEYDFDYSQALPNRFAGKISEERLVVVLDPEVSQVFTTAESVKAVLRALVAALPNGAKRKVRGAAELKILNASKFLRHAVLESIQAKMALLFVEDKHGKLASLHSFGL